jgi:CheY-like chemotaxis protein
MSTRILVVDDNPTIRHLAGTILQGRGFEVLQAADVGNAFALLMERPAGVDLVLVDAAIAGPNGAPLALLMQEHEALRTVPVVLMGRKTEHASADTTEQKGALGGLKKPFDAEALIAVVEDAIGMAARWRARGEALAAGSRDEYERTPTGSLRRVQTNETPPGAGPDSANQYAHEVALSGDMRVIPIGAALQLLQIEGQTGVLLVRDGEVEVTVALRKGLIDLVLARGVGREFRLGRYLVERGLIAPEDIDQLLRDQPGAGDSGPSGEHERRLIGTVLVEAGRVTKDQLREALARQSSELVYEVLRWPRGRFEFRPTLLPPLAQTAKLALPVASVVMEGFRRVDEWRVVERGLGSLESVLQRDGITEDADRIGRLTVPEQRVLAMVDGERTVRTIVEQSHMSKFDACRILFQLLEARLVRRRVS